MEVIFEKAKSWIDKNLPFVIYTKPDSESICAVFQNDDKLYSIKDFTESGFAFVSFDSKNKYYIPTIKSDVFIENWVKTAFKLNEDIDLTFTEEDKHNFEKLVSKAIVEINNNTFEKVVLSRKESIKVNNFDFITVFKKLLDTYSNTFKYCFFHPKIGFWIGATPEQLCKVENNVLKTVSIAGTQKVTLDKNYIWLDKEKNEQKIVTDYILNNLKEFSNNISKTEPYSIAAGSIVHLKTDIQAEITSVELLSEFLKKLHPTPAVCGLPKEVSKEFILANEGYDREYYSGFLGELNIDVETKSLKKSDLFVNLRCMNIENDIANIYVGCGITKDSIPEKEFLETVNKSKTMKTVL